MSRPAKRQLTVRFGDGSTAPLGVRRTRDPQPGTRPVLFVHGPPGWAWTWNAYLRRPPDGCHAIALDRPGFGRSASAGTRTDFEDHSNAIEAVLSSLAPGPKPILVGHSLGGPICAWAGAKWPNRFAGLVLIAPALDPRFEFPRWYNRLAKRIAWVLPRPVRRANEEIYAALEQTRRLEPMLSRITAPTVVLHGKRDRLVSYENMAYAERHLGSASDPQTITLDRAGHLIPWTHRKLVNDTIARLASGSD